MTPQFIFLLAVAFLALFLVAPLFRDVSLSGPALVQARAFPHPQDQTLTTAQVGTADTENGTDDEEGLDDEEDDDEEDDDEADDPDADSDTVDTGTVDTDAVNAGASDALESSAGVCKSNWGPVIEGCPCTQNSDCKSNQCTDNKRCNAQPVLNIGDACSLADSTAPEYLPPDRTKLVLECDNGSFKEQVLAVGDTCPSDRTKPTDIVLVCVHGTFAVEDNNTSSVIKLQLGDTCTTAATNLADNTTCLQGKVVCSADAACSGGMSCTNNACVAGGK